MLSQIDRNETHLVQKITNFDRTELIRFQTVPIDSVGDFNTVECFGTLQEAREAVGLAQPPQVADKPRTLKEVKQTKAEKSAAQSAATAKRKGKSNKKAA